MDKTVNRYNLIATAVITLLFSVQGLGWTPPIGVPEPEFGINEDHNIYKGKIFAFSTGSKVYPDAGNGPYTHYIDNSSPNATDKDNPYGSPEKPRLTIPNTIDQPGAVIEIHGESYTFGQRNWTAKGKKELPIFIRGISKTKRPLISDSKIYLTGEYLIVENLRLSNTRAVVRTFEGGDAAHHIAVRGIESYNLKSSALTATSSDTTVKTNNIVFFDNFLHGDAFDPKGSEFPQFDGCGVYLSSGSDRVWIVDNTIETFPGDAVGGGHAAKYTVTNYFIGRNIMRTCGENAIDLKEVENIVISQNKMYDMQGLSSGSDGTAVVVHYGPNLSSKNVWIIGNEIYDCKDKGIQIGGDQLFDVYIIGNLIRDIKNESKNASAYKTWSSKTVHIINNTFYNVDVGVQSDVTTKDAVLIFLNNLIYNASEIFLSMSGSWHLNNSVVKNNLFYSENNEVKISWGGKISNLAGFKANTGNLVAVIQAKPLLMDIDNNDFHLINDTLESNPAIDAGVMHSYDSLFYSMFQVQLGRDYGGNIRPADGLGNGGALFDIGCYEYAGPGENIGKPSNFRISK